MTTAPVLASPFKFSAIGKDVIVMPAIADSGLVPTRTEIDAGTNIKLHLDKDSGLTGFTITPNTITMTDLGSGVGYPLDDGSTYGTASLTCHQAKTGSSDDVRSVFTEGDTIYLMICDTTDTAGLEADTFALTVRLIDKSRAGGSMLMVQVDIGLAARGITIPT